MAENLQITKKQVVLLLLGVMLAAFLGITAGTYFVKLEAGHDDARVGGNIKLKVGEAFPNYTFMGLDGQMADLQKTLEGKKSLLVFLSTDCHPCGELTKKFTEEYPKAGADYKLLGISYEPLPKLTQYREERKVSFPVYQDMLGKFTAQYGINSFPTLVGLNEKQQIVFIEFGNRERQDLEDYLKKL